MSQDERNSADPIELEQSTARGAKRIFVRFVLVVVGLNALIGAAMMAYDITDTIFTTKEFLSASGKTATGVAQRLHKAHPERPMEAVIAEAAVLMSMPMALLTPSGEVRFSSSQRLSELLPSVYPQGPTPGLTMAIRKQLGPLSGGWMVSPFDGRRNLLVVVPRAFDTEGLSEYMTVGAAIMGLGVGVTLLFMLLTANWVLHQPLRRLVDQLTGALARDVERRRAAEESAVAAREEAERHLAFLNNLLDASQWVGIVATDAEERIQIFNRAAEEILGHSADDAVGRMTLDDLRTQTHRRATHEVHLRKLMKPALDEEFLVDKSGKEHLLQVSASDIRGADGTRIGQLLIFIDVTDRRRLEAELHLNELQLIQAAKMASLGEMATGIAHELNQPLNNIGLLASRISRRVGRQGADADDTAFVTERLQKLEQQVRRAGKIIDQLRTFGHPGSKHVAPVVLARPVHNVLDLLRQQLVDRGIGLEVKLPPDLPLVIADESELEQVLINLLNNARDALSEPDVPERERWVRLEAVTGDLDGEAAVLLRVADNGPGIPADVAERIFQPFFTTKEVGKGTGLGLSISYSIVQGFGGKLSVASERGGGAVFTVALRASDRTAPIEASLGAAPQS